MKSSEAKAELTALLKQIKTRHPEQEEIIDALSPLAFSHVELLEEWREKDIRPREAFTQATLPVDVTEALRAAKKLSDAMGKGFSSNAEHAKKLYEALEKRPSPIKKLCHAVLSENMEPLEEFLKKHNMPEQKELLSMLLLQVARAMAAKAALGVKAEETKGGTQRLCPICGSHPDMSIIFEQEGKRFLHCSLCAHRWRYSRTACPHCGNEEPKNITVLYDESIPTEKAELCKNCGQYILSVDARTLAIPVELAYYVTLGMGHLDILAQENMEKES